MKYLAYVPENFTNHKGLVNHIHGEEHDVNKYELSVIAQFNKHNGLPITSPVHTPPIDKFYIDSNKEHILLDDVLFVEVGGVGFYPLSTDGLREVLNTFNTYLCDVSPSKQHLRKTYFRKLINLHHKGIT